MKAKPPGKQQPARGSAISRREAPEPEVVVEADDPEEGEPEIVEPIEEEPEILEVETVEPEDRAIDEATRSPSRWPREAPGALVPTDPLQRYLSEVRKHPLLDPTEEHDLAVRWREQGDRAAAARLVDGESTPGGDRSRASTSRPSRTSSTSCRRATSACSRR